MRKKVLFVSIIFWICTILTASPVSAKKNKKVYVISEVSFENDLENYDIFPEVYGVRTLKYNKSGLIKSYQEVINRSYYEYDDDDDYESDNYRCVTTYTYKYKGSHISKIKCKENNDGDVSNWSANKIVYDKSDRVKKIYFSTGSTPESFTYNKKNQVKKYKGYFTLNYTYQNGVVSKIVDNYEGSNMTTSFINTKNSGRLVQYVSTRKDPILGDYKIIVKIKYKKLSLSSGKAKKVKKQQEFLKDYFLYDFYGLYDDYD